MRWQHCHDITSLEIALSAHRFFSFLSRCWCFPRGQRLTAVLSSNSSPVSGTYACDSRRWHHAGFPAVWTNDAGMTCVSGKGEAAHCAAAVWLTAPLFLLSPSVSWKVPFSLEFLSNLCCCITPTSWWVTPWACCWWQQTPSLALFGYINHLSPSIFYTGLPFLSALIPFIVPGPCPQSVTDILKCFWVFVFKEVCDHSSGLCHTGLVCLKLQLFIHREICTREVLFG